MNYYKNARLVIMTGLVFCYCLAGCSGKQGTVSIEWEKGKAIALVIPLEMIADIPNDMVVPVWHVHLLGLQDDILGSYGYSEDAVIFQPAIPFTRGLTYVVAYKDKTIAQIKIPPSSEKSPVVNAIYPAQDTLPENLLKIHIRFSQPMQEGQSLQYITLLRNNRDTVPGVFLDMQQELWNDDRTVLTLWLDPGRIKRDLQPNLKMGPPLREGERYTMIVQPGWRAATGIPLGYPYQKGFVVGSRDSLSPVPGTWAIAVPPAGIIGPLRIDFHEPLDFVLLMHTVYIIDSTNSEVKGHLDYKQNGTGVLFIPDAAWKAGNYTIEIESRLEDLAGNNLNRLFDNDLSKPLTHTQQAVFKRTFTVK